MRLFEANLASGIRWPYQTSFVNPTPLRQPPQLKVQPSANAGSFCSGKMGRLVRFDSQEERNFYQELERLPQVLYYQEQPIALPHANGTRPAKYYPDVLISFTDGRSVIAEIKQCHSPLRLETLIKARHLIEYCEQAGMGFFIGDHRRSFHGLLSMARDQVFEGELARLAMRGTVPWKELITLRDRLGRSAVELTAAMLRVGLAVEADPVRARNASPEETASISEVMRWFLPADDDEPAGSRSAASASEVTARPREIRSGSVRR